jgi:hypothetical protein
VVLALILSLRRVLSSLFQPGDPAARLLSGLASPVQYDLPRSISLHSINLPLQI